MINHHIPSAFYRLFEWFCRPELFEELQGDLEEAFEENSALYGISRARSVYRKEVLKMMRPSVFRYWRIPVAFNHAIMFRNYFKTSYRSLMKTPVTSFINIFGLSIAIGICVFVYSYARWTYSTDQFHKNKDQVYLATFLANRDGSLRQHGQTPRPLGEMLRGDFPQVRKMCRIEDRNAVVKHGDNVFHERIRYVDHQFLELFTFPLKWGIAGSLADVSSIILSEEMAIKYFGDENPLGQELVVKLDESRSKSFRITGVAAAFPDAHTIDFDFLINFENLRLLDYDFADWSAFVSATLIQVDNPSDLETIKQGMEKYKVLQNEAVREAWAIDSFAFEPLATLHERSEHIKTDISRSSADNYTTVIFFSVIGTFLLALACFNYINISIVSAAKRLKEIGVRKTIGATRQIVIVQFLAENVVVTFFALILGIILGATLFIPWFEQVWHFNMGFTLNDFNLWIYLPLIMLITALASGIYPAFYISKFETIRILKGSVQFGKRNPLTKLFLGFQLVLACILITSAVMFAQNTSYLTKRSWGYDQKSVLYANVPDLSAFEQLRAVMSQNPDVLSISGSTHHIGKNNTIAVIDMPDRPYEVDQFSVDGSYFETMGLQLTKGRTFKAHHENDKQAVVVNESLVRSMALVDQPVGSDEGSSPVGQVFRLDSMRYEIIGVVADFHHYSFSNKVRPAIFTMADPEPYHYLSIQVRSGSEREAYRALQAQWTSLFPEIPFQGGYQEDVWGNYFLAAGLHTRVLTNVAFIAVLLATLGLYGLMTLNVAGRVREFSIRKVLGAGLHHITASIAGQYMLLFVMALTLGAPVSYVLIKLLIEFAYAYHMPINFSGVTIAVAILMLVLLTTISIQIRKVLQSNPVRGLKVE